jgi:hypothetical protein
VGNGRLVLSTHLDREEEVAGVMGLRPYEGVVVEGLATRHITLERKRGI